MRIIELYKFTLGATTWTYTSGDETINYLAEDYTPVAMGRGKAESKNELSKANLEVRLDLSDPLAQQLITQFTEKLMSLTLYVQDQEAVTTAIAWKGRLSSIKPTGDQVNMTFESVFTSLRRPGLRARYQKNCRHVLYGTECAVLLASFETVGNATDVNGQLITVTEASGQADGYWIGGMLQAPDGIYGFIIDHVGTLITLQRPLDSLQAEFDLSGPPVAVNLYPGCDRLRQTCDTKFSNLDNFGGFPWIPSRNPLDGSSIL